MSDPFDDVNRIARELNEVNRISDVIQQVDHAGRMVDVTLQAAAKPIRDAVQSAMSQVDAAKPIIDEAARIYREQTAHLRQMERHMDALRSMQRHMDAIASVTRNLGYRW